jgi:TatD DNase family protein
LAIRVIDAHSHLDEIADVHGAIAKARSSNIVAIIAVGTCKESNIKVARLSEIYKDYVYHAIGIHPWNLESLDLEEEFDYLRSASRNCIGIGEIGLDYRIKTDRNLQRKVFSEALSIAESRNLPVIIHARAAWSDAYKMVKDVGVEKAVFHWFSGSDSVLRKIVRDGYLISATPAASYSLTHIKAIKLTPIEYIIVESDSPVSYRNVASDPSWAVKSLEAVAKIKGARIEDLADKVLENTCRIYNIKIHRKIF